MRTRKESRARKYLMAALLGAGIGFGGLAGTPHRARNVVNSIRHKRPDYKNRKPKRVRTPNEAQRAFTLARETKRQRDYNRCIFNNPCLQN